MGQTASEIRRELDEKRHELSHDVDQIEQKVRSTFDINRYVEERPLMATGAAVLAGFLLGNMVGGGGSQKQQRRDYYGYGGYYGGYAPQGTTYGYAPQGAYYSGTSQPSQQQSQQGGAHLMDEVKHSVKQSFQRTSGNKNVEDTVSNVTAALTALLVDKAKEMLDRNLPGFSEKYEQAQHQQHQHSNQDRVQGTTYSTTMRDQETGQTSGTSGSEHLGPSSSRST